MDNAIEITNLTKRYGTFTAVNNLNLSIRKGEIFGLLGPNGAGKSTTILMLLGLTDPSSGKISVCGIDPVSSPIRVKRKVGYLPEDVGFYDDFTGLENLMYTGSLNDIPKSQLQKTAEEVLVKVGLKQEMHKKVGKYSRGMRQRLGFADVLIKKPEVIILDEPTLGIDPAGVKEFLDLIVELSRKEKITVLFSSHHLHQVQQVCDRVGIFVKGNLLAEGNIGELAKKLFANHSCTIEAEVIPLNSQSTAKDFAFELEKKITKLEYVQQVKTDENRLLIESGEDVSARVSQLIVQEGFGLGYLTKKIYGLDEIYHQYFQHTETSKS